MARPEAGCPQNFSAFFHVSEIAADLWLWLLAPKVLTNVRLLDEQFWCRPAAAIEMGMNYGNAVSDTRQLLPCVWLVGWKASFFYFSCVDCTVASKLGWQRGDVTSQTRGDAMVYHVIKSNCRPD
jgi:hypothetical protein